MNWLELTDALLTQATSTFGERVVYWPASEPSFEITAIFDATFQMLEPGGNAMIQSTQPRLGVKLSDFACPPAEGDRVEVRGTIYDVVEYQPDGQGGAMLMLQRCSRA